jgi:SAM-dependent methyltransferase
VTDRTSEFFDRYAVDFDSIYGNDNKALERVVNRLFRRAMLTRYQKTIAGCQPVAGKSVIDVGCGPGHYSITLASQGANVLGLDFAPGMLKIAREHAEVAGVAERCNFALGDFLTYPLAERFDYVIVMGFMDYVHDPRAIIERVLDVVQLRAFLSFPKAGGPLAWQRQWRYRNRCDLFLYGEKQIHDLLAPTGAPFTIDAIGRDFFVTLSPRASG